MMVFISGGCKNGKSTAAENIAVALEKQASRQFADSCLYYIATMIPHDKEDLERIARHIEARKDKGFVTLEEGLAVGCLADGRNHGSFLLDSVTAYLSNLMFKADGSVDMACGKKAAAELLQLAQTAQNTVFVSDYIYADAEDYDELTEAYRRNLAFADKALAGAADLVLEVCATGITVHKGSLSDIIEGAKDAGALCIAAESKGEQS